MIRVGIRPNLVGHSRFLIYLSRVPLQFLAGRVCHDFYKFFKFLSRVPSYKTAGQESPDFFTSTRSKIFVASNIKTEYQL